MEGETLNFYQDFQIIANYAIILECLDLAVYFLVQKLRNKEKTPSWILVFSMFFTSAGIMQAIRVIISFISESDQSLIDLLNRFNLLIVTITSIFIVYFFKDFFKRESQKARRVLNACMVFTILFSFINAFNFFLTDYINLISMACAGISFFFDLVFPVYLVFFLLKKSDDSTKKSFFLIFIGMILTMVATLFNSQLIQERIQVIMVPDVFIAFNSVNLVVFICSLALIIANFFYIPPVEDFFWIDDILGVYIYDSQNNVILYKANFEEEGVGHGISPDTNLESSEDHEKLLVGGIVGIGALMKEITSDSGRELEYIDQGAVKVFISHEENLIFILLARHYLPLYKLKLYNFKQEFLIYYADLVPEWIDKTEKFKTVDKLVSNQFLKVPYRTGSKEAS